ncbi:MAG: amino acid permease [Deltaproteobacteria bacterium]|nr:amino acid permease [Deltaproteobacteria bacterium]
MALEKKLSLIDVFSIATGAMISSGIFILPGLAFARTGPGVFISYILAGFMALLGTFSVIELATAMPRAGGVYYFVTRAMGPLSGTVSGIFSWVAVSLKSAFAIFGISEVVHVLTGLSLVPVSMVMTAAFVGMNLYGVKETANLETILVFILLLIMTAYIIVGFGHMDVRRFENIAPHGFNSIVITAGFVFVSFGGLVSVASVSEEVNNPTRNIPLGLISALLVVTVIYGFLLMVTVGVLSPEKFGSSVTPIADSARIFSGKGGYTAITVAAALAFITTAISGIMSASRFPLALARDGLLPEFFSKVAGKDKTPFVSILATGIFIAVTLLLPLDVLVKAASTVILTANLFANAAVIILRESRIQNYRPTFKAPFYPWLQLASIILFGFFIIDMGISTIEISSGLLIFALVIYFLYGRKRESRDYAFLHIIARITNRKIKSRHLETELREIIHERDDVSHDEFDEIIKKCTIFDIESPMTRQDFFSMVSRDFADLTTISSEEISTLLEERESESSTAVTEFVAIPHIVLECEDEFLMMVARAKEGISFSEDASDIKAVFIIAGSKNTRLMHLRALAAISQTVSEKDFEEKWMSSTGINQLRDLILLSGRKRLGTHQ